MTKASRICSGWSRESAKVEEKVKGDVKEEATEEAKEDPKEDPNEAAAGKLKCMSDEHLGSTYRPTRAFRSDIHSSCELIYK